MKLSLVSALLFIAPLASRGGQQTPSHQAVNESGLTRLIAAGMREQTATDDTLQLMVIYRLRFRAVPGSWEQYVAASEARFRAAESAPQAEDCLPRCGNASARQAFEHHKRHTLYDFLTGRAERVAIHYADREQDLSGARGAELALMYAMGAAAGEDQGQTVAVLVWLRLAEHELKRSSQDQALVRELGVALREQRRRAVREASGVRR